MRRLATVAVAMLLGMGVASARGKANNDIGQWAKTPPMGWNSWDCFGPSVVESEVKANADYMAANLLKYGWEYVVVDIRWFVDNQTTGIYLQDGTQQYVVDKWGRYTPSLTRFPSAKGGKGFKPLADYCHKLGLKFGIHIMRGMPKEAARLKCPVKGLKGVTCDQISSNDSACTWLRDNLKVECSERGQAYYNSIFKLYAEWGVDYVKVDDIARPYHKGEIQMIHNAIENCGRPIVLSLSPGQTPLGEIDHLRETANLWRTVDDFWDNWSSLNYQFGMCAKWAPLIKEGHWPDADMLPLGHLCIRGERGKDRQTNFTRDEQYTLMNLWTIFKSPLMFGGHLPDNDEFTNSLLTNEEVLRMHRTSVNNRQVSSKNGRIVWSADDPESGDKWAALFYAVGESVVNPANALYRSGTISIATPGYSTAVDVQIPKGSTTLMLVVDAQEAMDYDHADWLEPTLTLDDGTTVDLTTCKMRQQRVGWGKTQVDKSVAGSLLTVNGKTYAKGIGTHATSVLFFEIPANTVRFTATAGIDNSAVSQANANSAMEFLVYNYDATKDPKTVSTTNVTLDLRDLGIASGTPCTITDVWSGTTLGTFKDNEFAPALRSHASGLYKITPLK